MGDLAARSGGVAVLAALAVVVVAGLCLRIGWAIDQPSSPPPDAVAYERIAASLYEGDGFDARAPGVEREVQPSSSYAPGLPLLVAGLYVLSGGPNLDFALIVLALVGALAIPLAFLLGRRFAVAVCNPVGDKRRWQGPVAGLIAAIAIAIYPALLQYQGVLLTEALAATLLVAAFVAVFAACARSRPWLWRGVGALHGARALVRPEYLTIAVLLPLTNLLRLTQPPADGPIRDDMRRHSARRRVVGGVLASLVGTALVLAPWAIRNAIVLERVVPISTGGGKALYIGTYVEADGDGPQLRELLLDRRPALRERLERGGPVDEPDRMALERVLAVVATESYPGLETDAALGRLGRQNLGDAVTQDPVGLADMLLDKSYATWTHTPRAVIGRQPWRTLQWAIVILSLVGLAGLAVRRRFEFVPAAIVLAYMTFVGALLIASPRRELVVLPLLAALAGSGVTWCADSLARWRS
jgi:hypothetical protein